MQRQELGLAKKEASEGNPNEAQALPGIIVGIASGDA
jgi:hypothetical protein